MENIVAQLQEIADQICNDYCRYPQEWDEDQTGIELSESEICANCPLNRLT